MGNKKNNLTIALFFIFLFLVLIPITLFFLKQKTVYSTTQTKIASSLEVPELYKGISWKSYTVNDKDKLNIILETEKDLEIPLKGHAWVADVANKRDVTNYYIKDLEKEGWVVDGSHLKLKKFTLNGLFAGGACGSLDEFIGFKDGMIRTVAISQNQKNCLPFSISKSDGQVSEYIIFISEFTPVDHIASYINNYARK